LQPVFCRQTRTQAGIALECYKSAVQIQGETQPLRDSKSHGQRLGTIREEKIFEALDRRKKPEARILKLFCDCRTNYLQHQARDQLSRPENKQSVIMNTVQLSNKLRRCLSWGAAYHNQLELPINQCAFDTADKKLKAALESSLGVMSHTTRRILSDELQLVQSAHENALPTEWLVLAEFLNRHPPDQSTEAELNLL
ncbi:hypothetical protein PSTT_11204, partial [Puccinia striiformis]